MVRQYLRFFGELKLFRDFPFKVRGNLLNYIVFTLAGTQKQTIFAT